MFLLNCCLLLTPNENWNPNLIVPATIEINSNLVEEIFDNFFPLPFNHQIFGGLQKNKTIGATCVSKKTLALLMLLLFVVKTF